MKDEPEIEKLLENFTRRSAPPGLRDKILQAARREASARRILTPAWRWALAASLILLGFFILADFGVSAGEQDRLSTLLNLPATKAISPEKAADKKADELLACLPDLDSGSKQLLRRTILNEERAANQSQRSGQRFTEEINEY
jgi:hypothetical protein